MPSYVRCRLCGTHTNKLLITNTNASVHSEVLGFPWYHASRGSVCVYERNTVFWAYATESRTNKTFDLRLSLTLRMCMRAVDSWNAFRRMRLSFYAATCFTFFDKHTTLTLEWTEIMNMEYGSKSKTINFEFFPWKNTLDFFLLWNFTVGFVPRDRNSDYSSISLKKIVFCFEHFHFKNNFFSILFIFITICVCVFCVN